MCHFFLFSSPDSLSLTLCLPLSNFRQDPKSSRRPKYSPFLCRHTSIRLPHPQNPRKVKPTSIWLSSNVPPITPVDEGDIEPPTVPDKWGEKSIPETGPLTKLASSDPPSYKDGWGIDDAKQSNRVFVISNGSAIVEDDCKSEDLKRETEKDEREISRSFGSSPEEEDERNREILALPLLSRSVFITRCLRLKGQPPIEKAALLALGASPSEIRQQFGKGARMWECFIVCI
ncbi:hypothetical protein L1987_40185 [Smallanthus sonchifolius]|uniref:Uncharacterized protein n=1 Tax=Smallanthus sonchifolius TaxID=185202 RepID=A0ACB9GUV1_9ASTR|nr:hypothetical protein L1987_40185 [Smallanthus sonchifolius]